VPRLAVVPGAAQPVPGAGALLRPVPSRGGAGTVLPTGSGGRQGGRLALAARRDGTQTSRLRPGLAALPFELLRDAAADRRPGPPLRGGTGGPWVAGRHGDLVRQ